MLSSNLQSILDNRLRYLPDITRKAINSVDWPSELVTIGKKYGMHVDEMEDFQSVVMRAMTGLLAPDKFESELISALALSPANAEKILLDVNDHVFEPIHDYVMNKGAAQDPLRSTGLVLEQGVEEAAPVIAPQPQTQTAPAATVVFEVPGSPEPAPKPAAKPSVNGDFESFFVVK
jgi:hypothetical protein